MCERPCHSFKAPSLKFPVERALVEILAKMLVPDESLYMGTACQDRLLGNSSVSAKFIRIVLAI